MFTNQSHYFHLTSPVRGVPAPVRRAIHHMLASFSEEIKLAELSEVAGISKAALNRCFQSRFERTPINWLWTFRAILAKELINQAPDWDLTDIAFLCGFNSSAHFSRYFKRVTRISPRDYRQRIRAAGRAPRSFDCSISWNHPSLKAAFLHMVS